MTTTTTTISGGILPKEYQDLRDTVADFARTVVAPVSAKHDAEHSFPYEIVAKMGEMGLFGLPFPEEYGGRAATTSRCRWYLRSWARLTNR